MGAIEVARSKAPEQQALTGPARYWSLVVITRGLSSDTTSPLLTRTLSKTVCAVLFLSSGLLLRLLIGLILRHNSKRARHEGPAPGDESERLGRNLAEIILLRQRGPVPST